MTEREIIEFLGWNDNVNLTTRAYNALKRESIHTIQDLESKVICDLREIRNVGMGTVKNILAALKEYNGHELTCDHDDQSCMKWLNGEKRH